MWEELSIKNGIFTAGSYSSRLKVPGGWIVKTVIITAGNNDRNVALSQIFIQDQKHTWTLN